ncbi:endonuclease III [Myxococcota bacterium]|nr:endonuclease III [Myxococcota bacterium]MCZ7617055.1 endonuclease III [Myxococcota bacterium]
MSPETPAERRRRAGRIARALEAAYPEARCALAFRSPFELLIATILSAQCTDKKVNEVTPALFARYPTPEALATAPLADIEQRIRPTGFYRQKARAIQGSAHEIATRFGGRVPDSMEALLTLPGVARKTANVVLGNAFGVPALPVDTHMKRVHARLGLTTSDDPVRIEQELMEWLPPSAWTPYAHRVIHHGRVCCVAHEPRCDACPLATDCPWPRARESARPSASRKSARRARAAPAARSRHA